MRVLFVIRSLGRGGAERQLTQLATGLAGRGHAVHVVTLHPDHALAGGLDAAGVTLSNLARAGRWDLTALVRGLLRESRRFGPDVVHSYMDVPNVLTALLRPALGGATLFWGFRASNMDLAHYGRLPGILFKAERVLSGLPDAIVVNSQAGRDHRVRHGIPARRMVVVPNGVDTSRFRPDTAARDATRARLGISRETPVIGLVGRIDPMKDYPNLLRAFARILHRVPQVRLVTAGTDPHGQRPRLEAVARELGVAARIQWLGPQDDMNGFYNAIDVLANSSAFGEGFPNAVAEAMACGTPCIATDVGDTRSLFADPESLVPPADDEALGEALERLLRLTPSERGELGRLARNHIGERFSVQGMVDRTEDLLATLARKSGRAVPRSAEGGLAS